MRADRCAYELLETLATCSTAACRSRSRRLERTLPRQHAIVGLTQSAQRSRFAAAAQRLPGFVSAGAMGATRTRRVRARRHDQAWRRRPGGVGVESATAPRSSSTRGSVDRDCARSRSRLTRCSVSRRAATSWRPRMGEAAAEVAAAPFALLLFVLALRRRPESPSQLLAFCTSCGGRGGGVDAVPGPGRGDRRVPVVDDVERSRSRCAALEPAVERHRGGRDDRWARSVA